SINHSLRNLVKRSLEGYEVDDYKLRNIIRDICLDIDSGMAQDSRHLRGMDSLFQQAKSDKFSNNWKTRIIRAYLSRAKQGLSASKVRVLKEAGIKVKEVKKDKRRIPASGS